MRMPPMRVPPGTMPLSPRRVGSKPALAAALFGSTVCTSAPLFTLSARMTFSGATCTLSEGATTRPNSMSCGTMRLTVLMGMAKPTPADVPVLVKMAVLTPTTWPLFRAHV